jgi:hypothetical protein
MKIYRPKRDQRETKRTSEGLAARPKKSYSTKKNALASWRQIDE